MVMTLGNWTMYVQEQALGTPEPKYSLSVHEPREAGGQTSRPAPRARSECIPPQA